MTSNASLASLTHAVSLASVDTNYGAISSQPMLLIELKAKDTSGLRVSV